MEISWKRKIWFLVLAAVVSLTGNSQPAIASQEDISPQTPPVSDLHKPKDKASPDRETEEEIFLKEAHSKMLREGKYEQLDRGMNQIQQEYEEGKRDDIDLMHMFRAFKDPDPALEENYNAWVALYPQSYAAHQARAIYYSKLAFKALFAGTDISQLTEQEKADMQHYESLAFEDNKTAIALTAKPFFAYVKMIELGQFGGLRDLSRQMLDLADKIDPENFVARINYMPVLETRWGGNLEQMKQFREEVRKAGLPENQQVYFDDLLTYEKNWTAKNDNKAHSAMLQEGKYDQLDREMNQIQQEYEAGKWDDTDLQNRFSVFDFDDTNATPGANYDAWVASYPQSYAAHQARADYYLGLALNARGTKYISKTSQQDINEMERYLGLAMEDDKSALTLASKPLLTYDNMLTLSVEGGSKKSSRQILDLADRIDPKNFIVRANYMDSLQPKWGGSFNEMKKFLEEVRKAGTSINVITHLEGQIFMALGDVCDNCDGLVHDYTEAAKWYRKAAEIGFYEGQFKLGQLYAKGQGVTQDLEESYFWLSLSSKNGDEQYVAERDKSAAKLSPQQLADMDKRVREFIPKLSP